jgi:hypothetical protein
MNGYQSDTIAPAQTGNIPIENLMGGFGITSGTGSVYDLALDPPIKTYKTGMQLMVVFHQTNAGADKINVNGKGEIPLLKFTDGTYQPIAPGDLVSSGIYMLVNRGSFFQVILGLNPSSIPPGVWTTKGEFDASGDTPMFPAGKAGDVYVVSQGGTISLWYQVWEKDVLYCRRDNMGNSEDWIVIPHLFAMP